MHRLPLFTGSGVLRAVLCPASCLLPQSDDDSGDTSARVGGTTVHHGIDRVGALMANEFVGPVAARRTALAEIADDAPGRDMFATLDIEALPVDLAAASLELPLAYDILARTARTLVDAHGAQIRDRAYADAVPPLAPYEIPMTLDAVEVIDGVVIITDWKTGRYHAGYREQVTLGALAMRAMLTTGPRGWGDEYIDDGEYRGQLVYLRDGVDTDAWEITNDGLDYLADSLVVLTGNVGRMRGRAITRDDVRPGDHCTYCKSINACPTSHEAFNTIERVDLAPSIIDRLDSVLATDEGAARLWLQLVALDAVAPKIREALIARAARQPFALPDGSIVGPVTERGDRYVADVDAVLARVTEAVGAEKAAEAMPVTVKRKAPIGAIEKALGKKGMAALEADGLVRRAPETTTVKATKRKQVA